MAGKSLPFEVPEGVEKFILREIKPESLELLNRKLFFSVGEVAKILNCTRRLINDRREQFPQIRCRWELERVRKKRMYSHTNIRFLWIIRYYLEVKYWRLKGIQKHFKGGGYNRNVRRQSNE